PLAGICQTETRELVGQIGSRPALLVLHASRTDQGAWQMAGEYMVLPTLQRRFLEGESSPEIGVTTLREGTTPILFGRPPTGELRGTLRAGVFKGARFAPGGQERERFEFSEEFPSMEGYSATIRCDATDARYASNLQMAVDAGKLLSGASTAFRPPPNTQASAVHFALPGVLPVLNRAAVQHALPFGLANGPTNNRPPIFPRKNYLHPHLPKGYQISQYESPIVQ